MTNKRSPSVGRRAVAGSSATGRATVSSQVPRPIGELRRPLALAIRAALLAAPLAVALSGPAGAQPGFDSKTIATNADGATSVFAADVDGDGDTDVLSASAAAGNNKIAWYENDGDQHFTLRTIATNAAGARAVFAADVDGDGDTDVLSASRFDNKIAWYENDGSQNFTALTIATNANGARSVFAADVDGDGDTDVLSASAYDDKIAWYENDGNQNFTLRTIAGNANGAVSVFAADVDGDGDTDVLSASYDDDKIAWYENDGSQNFTLLTIAANADDAYSVFAADVDGDGDTDVLSASFVDNKIAWYENDGSQTFTLRTIATNADGAFSVFAADVDGDGDTDVLSASLIDFKIAWYENDGMQGFAPRTIATNAGAARSVFATDVDGDGDTDVLSASALDAKIAWYENDGRQVFAPFGGVASIATSADDAYTVFAADVDGDGDTDVLSASRYDNKIAWYENDGSGSFTLRTIATNALGARFVFAADVDGDGDTDVLSASRDDDKIAWYDNDGSQNFTALTIATNADGAYSVFAADVDGDGDTDMLSASRFDDKIAWYENDGMQGFTLRTIATNADFAFSVFAADVDGDGDTDVLSASRFDNKIAWYDNDGSQTFTPRTIATNAAATQSVFAADVDGDGDTDVLSASRGDNKIAWYENDGSQNFTLRTIATNANDARSVLVADIDGDGDTDVLSASFFDDKIAWYKNDSSGNFTPLTIATSADGARSVFAADVDGDGDIDVLSASRFDDKIAWYENQTLHRTGAFDGGIDITTGAVAAQSVFAADVDGDGDTDVLSASSSVSPYDAKIAWYENDGSQNFALRTIAINADDARSVFAADVDGDGDTDVLSASDDDDKIAWYENDGSQNFTLRTIATNANSPYSVFATDVDGDGDIDVLSASFTGNKITWYENDGSQNFTALTIATNVGGARSVFAADIDGDGDIDVLSASGFDNKIAWFENDGSQNFTAVTIAANADGATSVFAADVDGDGDTDVLSASAFDNKIAWYENNGSQNFTLRTIATNADFARSVFAADVDGDGDIDVLSASSPLAPTTVNKIAWYENDGSQNFTLRTIATNADGARSVFAADVDGDGDTDVLSASRYDNKISWYPNCGGQFLFAGQASGPTAVLEGETVELLSLSYLHNGRAGDSSADLGAVSLKFTDDLGNPLNSAQIRARLAQIEVYLDDGDNVFDAGDTLLVADSLLDVTPAALSGGVVTLALTDGDVVVPPGGVAQLFVVGQVPTDLQTAQSFQVTLQQKPLPRPQAQDDASGSVLSLQCPMNAQSALVTAEPRPVVNLSVSANAGAEADQTAITVTATADKAVSGDQTVDVGVSGAGITSGDFTLIDTTITIPDGMTTGSVTFTVVDDTLLEGAETATLTLSNPAALIKLGNLTSQDVAITDNDAASVAIDDVMVDEGAGMATFTVALSGDVQGGFSVDAATAADTATFGDDYTNAAETLNFAGTDGETQTFTINITDDAILEGSEQFFANLSGATDGVTIADGQGIGTITDNDAASVAIDDVTVNEGAGTATFTVALSGDVQGGFSVDAATAEDTATVGDDYTNAAETLNFAGTDGETQTFTINITDDAILEGSEQFFANLSGATDGVTIADGQGIGTITDNDAASVAIDDVTVNEGAGTATFTVALTGAVQGDFSVAAATAGDTATAGDDYTGKAETLNFAGTNGETQTFTVNITDDAVIEGSEQFFANLSNATDGVTIADGQGVGTITDNDSASVAIDDVNVNETDGTATFTVALTGAVQGGFSVAAATADDTATAGDDYTGKAETLNFAGTDGETQSFTVNITDDAVLEGSEQFFANLSNPTGGVTIADGQGVGTIMDNEFPPVIEPAFFYILFGAQTGDVVGQVVATDPNDDIPATGAYAITAGNAAGALAIQDDGTLVIADASALVDGLLTITVEVTDATGLSASRDFVISVGERVFADGFEAD